MGVNRSVVNCFILEILLGFSLVFLIGVCRAVTNPSDVAAINGLYVALGSPPIPGWLASGGDPCGSGSWQGVTCNDASAIISITLVMVNLNGEFGDSLEAFSSIETINLSNNFIVGSIPSKLPASLINVFLSDNKLTGSIPSSLSSLSKLSAMSLNNNELTGEIPDAFDGLTVLVNLDLSNNNLSGHLPPTVQSLSSLTTLHLQNNQLSGTLDGLQDLPLRDLDVQNNLFSGPIPDKLLSIPNFRSDGNPFNSSIAPSSPPPASSETPLGPSPPAPPNSPFFPGSSSGRTPPPPSGRRPGRQQASASGPTASTESNSGNTKKTSSTRRIVWISIAAVLSFIILLLAILLFMPKCLREKRQTYRNQKRQEVYLGAGQNSRDGGSVVLPIQDEEKAPPPRPRPPPVAVMKPKEENRPKSVRSTPKPRNEEVVNKQMNEAPRRHQHEIDMSRFEIDLMQPPPPPPPPPPILAEKVIVNRIPAAASVPKPLTPATFARSYTIASLQQYTNSFSPDNLIGSGMIGNVYRAELPDGRFMAIKKLDKRVANQQKDEQFIELVNTLDNIRHTNVVELLGYCAEHGQKLLVYEYCASGTLQDALHSDDEFRKKHSWNTRIRMALGAARALEYLHEVCEPPIVHRNFKSANVLLDDELSIHVSDCGLAPLVSSGAVSQLSGQLLTTYGYGAPEFETGVYTSKSDVYSFGVVMLELLTGRMSYDRTRVRGEQSLARWAIPQLHDIDALSQMVDPVLNGKYHVKSLSHFADIISRCLLVEPEFRPLMSEVVQDLMEMIRRESPSKSVRD